MTSSTVPIETEALGTFGPSATCPSIVYCVHLCFDLLSGNSDYLGPSRLPGLLLHNHNLKDKGSRSKMHP